MAIYLITLLCLLNHTGFGGSRVVMALYALHLGADQLAIGALMALYALLPVVLAIYSGRLVDRVGPRLPMLGGNIGVLVGLLLPYFFPGLATLYVSALVLGAASQFFFVAVQGTAGAVGEPQDRVHNYAVLGIGFSMALLFGPLIAGFSIDHLGGFLAAYVSLAACLVIPTLVLWLKPGFLPKVAAGGAGPHKKRSAFELLRVARLRNTLITSGLLAAAWDLYQFYLPIYGNSIGMSASAIGVVMSSFAAAVFAIRLVLSRLSKRFGESEVLVYAIVVSGLTFLLFPLFTNPFLLAAVSFLLGLGVGCGQPIAGALIYALSPPGRAAEGTGVRVMINNFIHVVVPLAFGGIGVAFGFGPVFASSAGLLLAGSYYSYRSGARRPAA